MSSAPCVWNVSLVGRATYCFLILLDKPDMIHGEPFSTKYNLLIPKPHLPLPIRLKWNNICTHNQLPFEKNELSNIPLGFLKSQGLYLRQSHSHLRNQPVLKKLILARGKKNKTCWNCLAFCLFILIKIISMKLLKVLL